MTSKDITGSDAGQAVNTLLLNLALKRKAESSDANG